jgi:hypothetical protein
MVFAILNGFFVIYFAYCLGIDPPSSQGLDTLGLGLNLLGLYANLRAIPTVPETPKKED